MVGSSNFTLRGLGLTDQPNIELNLIVDGDRDRDDLLAWFEEIWNDSELTEDVRDEVLRQLERAYRHNSPEFIYFKTLFHLFEADLADKATEEEQLREARFTETAIWNMLYGFQRDGLRGVLSRLQNRGGCILADSVGLGKTFIALGAIKWHELRNEKVLVLCPKKLRDNWTEYLWHVRSETNPLARDKFDYTVLSHTDLSRRSGKVGDIDLEKFNWDMFDLVVIDESHNFRNARRNPSKPTRYQKLMDEIIRSGKRTKVLMLSATPVNNDLGDLKSQLDLMVGGSPQGFEGLGIRNLTSLIGDARRKFAEWLKAGGKDRKALISRLPPPLFGLLDHVTIARSRKHIERHYAGAIAEVGRFPTREAPESLFPEIDTSGRFPTFEHVHDEIAGLQLALYNPLRFVLDQHKYLYDPGGNFDQATREQFLIGMMKTNFLKRLESSVHSFGRTMHRLCDRIDARIDDIDRFAEQTVVPADDIPEELEGDEELAEAFEVGGALKFNLNHMDVAAWKRALEADRAKLWSLATAADHVPPNHDTKLDWLKEIIASKATNPTQNRNGEAIRKAIVFTAFADTARYLYDELVPFARDLGLNIGLVTGGGDSKASFGKARYQDILTNFAPRAKKRAAMAKMDQSAEIDILIATDCISEGQNLQDADLLINYDIHWNPVRVIQRFGRIDRIGSLHDRIRMVNFWPTPDLNRYIRLKDRVEARMALVDLSATGADNPLEEALAEAETNWRDHQLLRLKDEVFDLEDAQDGLTLAEFSLEDFRAELFDFAQRNADELRSAPLGLYALAPAEVEAGLLEPGVIFCLRRNGHAVAEADKTAVNTLDPYFLVYVRSDGSIRSGFTSPKSILDAMRALCAGRTHPIETLCAQFDDETLQGQQVDHFTDLALKAVESVTAGYAVKALGALASSKGMKVPDESQQPRELEQFELITWLIIRESK